MTPAWTCSRRRADAISIACAVGLFFLTLGLHAGYVVDVQTNPGHGYDFYYSLQGSPVGDALAWYDKAERLSLGRPVRDWLGWRPGYAWLLSGVFVLFGSGYEVALAANVVMAAATVLLVFLILRRLYGAPVALLASVLLSGRAEALMCSSATLSEPAGLFLLAWHFWLLLLGLERRSWKLLLASGLLFGLSNGTRPMSAVALPAYAVLTPWILWRGGQTWRLAIAFGVAVVAPAAVVILGFMSWNYWTHGIFTLSANVAGDVFAVTTPEFGGQWTGEVENVLHRQGVTTTQQKYAYCMAEGRRNFREHPEVFWGFFRQHARDALRDLQTSLGYAPLLALACGFWPLPPASERWRWGIGLVALAAVGAGIVWPTAGLAIFAGLLLAALLGRPTPAAALLGALLLLTLIPVFAFGQLQERLFVMFRWCYFGVVLGGLAAVGARIARPGATAANAWHEEARAAFDWLRWPRRVALAAVLYAATVVLYRNWLAPPTPGPAAPPGDWTRRFVAAESQAVPDAFTPEEQAAGDDSLFLQPNWSPGHSGDRGLLLQWGRWGPQPCHYFTQGNEPRAGRVGMSPRSYAYTALRWHTFNPDGTFAWCDAVWPGDGRPLAGRYGVLLGRVFETAPGARRIEALAWHELTDAGPAPGESQRATDDPSHRRWLEELIASGATVRTD